MADRVGQQNGHIYWYIGGGMGEPGFPINKFLVNICQSRVKKKLKNFCVDRVKA